MTTLMDEAVDVGTTKRLTLDVNTLDNVAAPLDASTIFLRVKDPDGIVSNHAIVRSTVGDYYSEFVVTKSGQWRFRWETTSPVRAQEGSFVVRRSEFVHFDPPLPQSEITWTVFEAMSWETWNQVSWTEWTGES